MNVYLSDIQAAAFAFPFVAALFTLPFAIKQYRKYGSVPWFITLLTYSFIFYLMCCYFLVLLPLPADHSTIVPGADQLHLIPFASFHSLVPIIHSDLGFADKLVALLTDASIYQYLFNILMLVPLGAYLRYFFKLRIRTCVLIGFGVSFSFEFLQYTGILGIYEHPYRFADVDDLIANTLGAWVGAAVCQKAMVLLPKMEEVERKAWETGTRATTTQRLLSLFLDLVILGVLALGIMALVRIWLDPRTELAAFSLADNLATALLFLLLYGAVPAVTKGQTPGQAILKLYTANLDGTRARPWKVLLRYTLLFAIIYLPLAFGVGVFSLIGSATEEMGGVPWFLATHVETVFWVGVAVVAIYLFILGVRVLMAWRGRRPLVMLYGLITHSRVLQAPVRRNKDAGSPLKAAAKTAPVSTTVEGSELPGDATVEGGVVPGGGAAIEDGVVPGGGADLPGSAAAESGAPIPGDASTSAAAGYAAAKTSMQN